MNWKVVLRVAAMSLTLCSASWAADGGAALHKSKVFGLSGSEWGGQCSHQSACTQGNKPRCEPDQRTHNERRIDEQASPQQRHPGCQ